MRSAKGFASYNRRFVDRIACMSDQLWAPWRIGFITGTETPPPAAGQFEPLWLPEADKGCFLCRGAAEVAGGDADRAAVDRENLVVGRTALSVVVLNRYPYNNGHLLVAPGRHAARLDELTDDEHLDLMRLSAQLCGVLEGQMKAEGFNVGLNLGRVAGAGVPGHLHWHIVPRWHGDTNFMPALASVRVIPQALEALFDLLSRSLKKSGE
jgi:ATP adenylyltransferase